MNILFVGPYRFNPVIDVEMAHLVFRDLIDPIKDYCDNIYLLTGSNNPEHIINHLKKSYDICPIVPNRVEKKLGRFGYILKGIRSVKKYNIDVVTNISGGISYGFDAVVIGKATNKKVILRFSGNEIKTQLIIGIYTGLKGRLLYVLDSLRQVLGIRLADRVIAMSPWEVRRLREYADNKDKIIHCPRGADVDRFKPKSKLGDNNFRVLFIGRKSREKGYDILLKVADILKNVKDLEFLVAGNFEKGVRGNVRFIGYVHPKELPELYRTADIVLLPSRSEGFPQVVAESLAMGKPCIVPQHIFGKYFDDLKLLVLCKLDPVDIANKILLLYNNPKFLRKISIFAREYATNRFNKDRYSLVYRYTLLNI